MIDRVAVRSWNSSVSFRAPGGDEQERQKDGRCPVIESHIGLHVTRALLIREQQSNKSYRLKEVLIQNAVR